MRNLFGYDSRVIRTPLSPAECVPRLREKTESWWSGPFSIRGKPLRGRVSADRFRVRRQSVLAFENLYHPMATGHIMPDAQGARIEVDFQLGWPARIFIGLWAGFALLFGFLRLLQPSQPGVPGLLEAFVGPLTFGAIGLIGFAFGRFIARHEPDAVTGLLAEALGALEESRAVE